MSRKKFRFNSGESKMENSISDLQEEVNANEPAQEEVISITETISFEEKITAAPAVVVKEEVKKPLFSKKEEEFKPVYNVEIQLVNYLENMGLGKAIDPVIGGKWQYSLYNLFKSVLNTSEQSDFNAQYNTILNFFNKNKNNIFNYNYIFRFPEYFPGTDKEFNVFRAMVVLAIETCDPKTRKSNVKNINLEKATENLTEAEKQKLINFYSA